MFRLSKSEKFAYIFMLPAIFSITILSIYPILYSFWLSLLDYVLTKPGPYEFVGIKNYIDVLGSDYFLRSFGITMKFALETVSMELLIGLALALILNESFKGRGVARALILIPWAIPDVVAGLIWRWIFNPNYGALNGLLYQFGLIHSYISWLGSPSTALECMSVALIWRELPLAAFLLLAGLQSIPPEMYESAKIDGASSLTSFIHITLPWLKPQISIVLILETMMSIRILSLVYVMTGGGPAGSTSVLAYYTWNEAFQYYNFGAGATLCYIIALLSFAFALVYAKLLSAESLY
ncbi:MAG: sugar ABC transporter permease [Candidatus Bathyarchaeia archaeon]|nr:sugar ABC transporter permease [Candidatus Bathyarchaeota archaeon]